MTAILGAAPGRGERRRRIRSCIRSADKAGQVEFSSDLIHRSSAHWSCVRSNENGQLCTEWELDQGIASRVVYTPDRFPAGCTAGVRISAIQVEDGSFETAADVPHIYLEFHPDSGLTIENARALALVLTESAAQLESWIEMFGAVTDPGADR